jgi:hypothetical protein
VRLWAPMKATPARFNRPRRSISLDIFVFKIGYNDLATDRSYEGGRNATRDRELSEASVEGGEAEVSGNGD